MRKLLLATSAVLGGAMGLAGVANAQGAGPISPTVVYPKVTNAPSLAPSSFQVHLDGQMNWYAGVAGSSLENAGGIKTAPYDLQGYIYLFPGFTAEAANGLQYGVAAEVRMPGSTGGFAGVSPGATSSSETLFWRRAYGFVGTPELGTLRFGMGDGIVTLYQTGVFNDFNDGGWDGDVNNFVQGNAQPVFPWADVGDLYTSNKVVYLSPSFSGLQFGVDFEPNTENLWNDSGCGSGADGALSCNRLTSQGLVPDYGRRRNTIAAGVQYTGKFDDVGINASLTGMKSGVVANNAPGGVNYNGLGVGAAGLTLSYAGFTVGGHLAGGQMNGDFALQPQGGRGTFAWLVGAEYATGPVIVGASYFQTQFAGNWSAGSSVARTENDTGVAVGATYTVASGFELFLSYLYGTRHQAGWDFAADGGAGAPGPGSNNTHAQIFALGTQLSW